MLRCLRRHACEAELFELAPKPFVARVREFLHHPVQVDECRELLRMRHAPTGRLLVRSRRVG